MSVKSEWNVKHYNKFDGLFYKELAHNYRQYEFDLKKLIEEIGIDEVKKVVKEMGGCDCGK